MFPIDVWHLSILYMYVDILSGDRMIVGMSISVRLATGFGGLTLSHALAPVTIPQIGSSQSWYQSDRFISYGLGSKFPILRN